jgi:Plasma-membrane choline transporter
MEYLLCCLQCCMWCLEKIMKFISKNAYIQTAIYCHGFCRASRNAFFLILRNILRVAAVNMISSFVLFVGKLFVSLSTTFLLYLVIAYNADIQMNSIMSPLVVTFILAYFVASMFSEIFGMAVETILCCYIADEEMFPPENRFAENELKFVMSNPGSKPAAKVQVRRLLIYSPSLMVIYIRYLSLGSRRCRVATVIIEFKHTNQLYREYLTDRDYF